MEWWKNGMMGIKSGVCSDFILKAVPRILMDLIPSNSIFQYLLSQLFEKTNLLKITLTMSKIQLAKNLTHSYKLILTVS